MSFHRFIPIKFHGGTLREYNGSVEYAGDGVEGDKAPEENPPFLACETGGNNC